MVDNYASTTANPTQAAGMYVSVQSEDEISALPYMTAALHNLGVSNLHAVDSKAFLEAYAGNNMLKWFNINGTLGITVEPQGGVPSVYTVYNDRLYTIAPDGQLDPATFQTILSTFSFFK